MPSRAALPAPCGLVGHPRPLLRCCRAASARLGRCLYDYAGPCVIVRPAVPRLPRAVRCSRSAGPRPPAPGSVLAHVGPGPVRYGSWGRYDILGAACARPAGALR